jgi:putative (di)nucleoside polyphosphate hydrolase
MLPLRPNVCLMILNKDNQLLIGERLGEPGEWQLPQGGIKDGQSVQEAAFEEAFEELGVEPELFLLERILHYRNNYEWKSIPACYEGVYRGQSQQFAVLRFLGEDSDIQLDRCLTIPELVERGCVQEFAHWKWIEVRDMTANVMGVRVPGYLGALEELVSHLI